MIFSKILYAVILVALYVVLIMFSPVEAYIAFVLAIAIPAVFLVNMLINRMLINVEYCVRKGIIFKGDTVDLRINVKNNWIFPTGDINIKLEIYYGDYKHKTEVVTFNAMPFSKKSIIHKIVAEYTGNIKIVIKKASMMDYSRIFDIPVGKKNCNNIITIFPKPFVININGTNIQNNELLESDEYDKNKKGNDKTEIFNIREYIPGDTVRDIHWKLTSKMDKCMVKEFSRPIANEIDLICEFTSDITSLDNMMAFDKVFEVAYSLGFNILVSELKFTLKVVDKNKRIYIENDISSEDEMVQDFVNIIGCEEYAKYSDGTEYDVNNIINDAKHSNILVVLSEIDMNLVNMLTEKSLTHQIFLVIIVKKNIDTIRPFVDMLSDKMDIYMVDANAKEMGGIYEIKL